MFKVNLGGCHLISDAVINEVRLEFIHNGALSTCTIPHFLFAAHRGKVTRQWKIWVKFAISASNQFLRVQSDRIYLSIEPKKLIKFRDNKL